MKEEIKKSLNFCGIYYIKAIETCCVSCKKNTTNENSSVRKTIQNRLMPLSNCAVCGKKNRVSLKIKNSTTQYSTILIKFQMISLK